MGTHNKLTLAAGLFAAAAALTPAEADAKSKVYIQNNTTRILKINTTSTLHSKYWSNRSNTIHPGRRAVLYETNRDTGVKNGKRFYFTSTVDAHGKTYGPEKLRLMLQLKGSLTHSHMWQSVKDQWGSQKTWEDEDGKKWTASWRLGKKRPLRIKYWSFFTGGDSDVDFAVNEEYSLPTGNGARLTHDWKKNHLNVLTYNVYMRPTSLFHNGQSKRAKMIPAKIRGYDVVVFQEAFDDDVRAVLISGMKKEGYKHVSRIVGKDKGTAQDGGIIIVSKYPIVKEAQEVFKDCSGWDCEADKGVLYVKINKQIKAGENNYFHVFGTHLNAGGFGVKVKQLKQVKRFINKQKIHKSQAVLIAGDMNIDLFDGPKFNRMLKELNAGYVKRKGMKFTHDGPVNDVYESNGRSYLDYVLYSKAHRHPIQKGSWAQTRMLRANDEWFETASKAMWDLSDHWPVYGNYHFAEDLGFDPGYDNQSGRRTPDSCETDADCPAGMRCEQVRKPTPKPPKSRAGRTRRPVVKRGVRTRALRPSAGTSRKSKVIKKSGPRVIKPFDTVGQCRVPPPK